MTDNSSATPFDFMQTMLPKWPKPNFSNWAFAEREDELEERTFAGMQRLNKTAWDRAEKTLDDHMTFVSHRLHEDFECAKALADCRMPDEALTTLQSFYARMADEYQAHLRHQMDLFRDTVNEGIETAEELGETALETATELSKAAEETIEEEKQAPAPTRRRTKSTSA